MDYSLCEAAINGDTQSLNDIMQSDPLILDKFLAGFFQCENPLHVATSNGQIHFVKELLHLKPKLAKVLDSQQRSALHLATDEGHHEIVKALIDVSPEMCLVRDRDGKNPLHVAAMKGNVSVLELLVQTNPEVAQVRVDRNETILHLCVKLDQLESLKLLLKMIGSPAFVNAKDNDGNTILHLCVKHNNLNSLDLLLNMIQSPAFVNAKDNDGNNILHLCVKHNQLASLEITLRMIKSKAFVNSKDNDGNTILHIAAMDKLYQMLDFIVMNSNIDVNEKNGSGQTVADLLYWEIRDGAELRELDYISVFFQNVNVGLRRDTELGEWITKLEDSLLVMASLLATMAFQAGVSPPGGVWQDDSNGHRAGEAVMAYNYAHSYPYFLHFNAIGFVASLSTIFLWLMSGFLFPNKLVASWILIITMGLAITSMVVTYGFSNFMVTPKTERKSAIAIAIEIIVSCSVMVLLLIKCTFGLVAFVIRWRRAKEFLERKRDERRRESNGESA